MTIAYAAGGTAFRREVIADAVSGAIVMHLTADRPAGGRLVLDRRYDPVCLLRRTAEGRTLSLDGHFDGGIAFRVEATLERCDGRVTVDGDGLRLEYTGPWSP